LLPGAEIREEPIYHEGVLIGYRRFEVGTGLFGADRFIGYRWLSY